MWRAVAASAVAAVSTIGLTAGVAIEVPAASFAIQVAWFGIVYAAAWILLPGGPARFASLRETMRRLRAEPTEA